MAEVRFVAIDPSFEVLVVREPLRLSAEQSREIDRIWACECQRRGEQLFDAPLLAHLEADRRRLVGRFVRYRDYLAGREAPQLFDWQPPVPVGVSGRVTCRGRVVLGRRAAHLTTWPGRWELVPSGGLDRTFADDARGRVDFQAQLLAELAEETPLERPTRAALEPFALAFDERDPSWQICVALEIALDAAAIARLEAAHSEEYDAFRVASPVDVIEAGLESEGELSPLTSALVRLPAPLLRAAS